MYAFIPWNPEAAPQWAKAVRMVERGVPYPKVIRATGMKSSTFYDRMRRRRAVVTWRPAAVRDGQQAE